jgi:sigma-B regulation protein RsbU (phosphoserine phosphatase)
MAEKILIAQEESESRRRISTSLRAEGYQMLEAEDLGRATRMLRKFPALLLVDVDLAAREGPGEWNTFGQICQAGDIPCLAFSSRGLLPAKIRETAPWAAETLLHPEDHNELLLKVANQFTIHRLTYEFKLAQHLLFQKQMELEKYLHSAAHIQKCLIPSRFPRVGRLEFSWRFMPCRKIGGDLFNVLQLDEETVMAYVLDVSGHGISSAMVTVSVYQSLSHHLGQILKQRLDTPPYYRILAPGEVLQKLDEEYPFERFEMFFTICYLLVNPASGRVRYCSAGHPPPVLVRADGRCEALSRGGTVIGLGGVVPFEEGEAVLEAGDRLYLYTDGVTEHANGASELYGEERLALQLARLQAFPLGEVCERVVDSLHAFGQGRSLEDDVTLLGIEYLGETTNGKGVS